MRKTIVAIVPAAGVGQRASAATPVPAGAAGGLPMPKQYQLLKGEPMLRWSVRALLADARISQVRVAVAPADMQASVVLAGLPRTIWRPCGGATRTDTVLAALEDAALEDDAWVLVHDAARPGLQPADLARLLDACLAGGQGGLLAQQVTDTVKQTAPDAPDRALATVARDGLWLAQTPQMFPAGLLRRALLQAREEGATVTDEASAVERLGHAPLLVPGGKRNFKITWAEDFAWMEKWL